MKALVDNDVILKSAHYALLEVLLTEFPPADVPLGVLGSARYVLTDVLKKSTYSDAEEVLARVTDFIEKNRILEPTQAELQLAAEFEANAQAESLFLDAGESLLSSILILRELPRLITGDKRAIAAIERLIDSCIRMGEITGKVMCLEQLVAERVTVDTVNTIKSAICRRPTIDKALSNCCSCSTATTELDVIMEGLNSYIRAVRTTAARALCA